MRLRLWIGVVITAITAECVATAHARQNEPQPWPRQFTLRDADGDGHPVFGNPTIVAYPLNEGLIPRATGVAFGDLDGDGDNDGVIINTTSRSPAHRQAAVTIVLNKGDGVFVHGEVYHVPTDLASVDLADFNGDRVLDIVTGNGYDESITIWRGRGDGTFGDDVTIPLGGQAMCVRTADFDDNGSMDIAVFLRNNQVAILLNRGDGTFEEPRFLAVPTVTQLYAGPPCPGPSLAVGDLNGDRLPDIVVPTGTSVRVLINKGGAEFAPPVAYPVQITGGGAYGLALADVDRDGHLDLAVALVGWPSKYLSILRNDGAGRFGVPVEYDMATRPNVPGGLYDPLTVTLADITGDGFPDVCVGNFSNPNVAVRHNNGDGTFGDRILYDVGAADLYVVRFAELSGDGMVDLAVLNFLGRSKMTVLLNRGDGNLLTLEGVPKEYEVLAGPYPWIDPWSVIAIDVDRDGDQDLVVAVSAVSRQSNVLVVHNDGGRFERWTPYAIGPMGGASTIHVAAGDFNDDGWPDLVCADSISPGGWIPPGKVWVLLNNKDGTFSAPTPYALDGVSPIRVAVGDLNGDGALDIAVLVTQVYPGNDQIPVDRRVMLMWNDGEGNFTIGPSQTVWTAPWFPAGGLTLDDLDGDRIMDIVAAVSHRDGPGVLAILRGLGGGNFAPAIQHNVPLAHRVAAPMFGHGREIWVAGGTQAWPNNQPFMTTFQQGQGSMFERGPAYNDDGLSAQQMMFREASSAPGRQAATLALANRTQDMLAVAHAGGGGIVRPWHHYGTPLISGFGVWDMLNADAATHHVVVTSSFSRNLSIRMQHSLPLSACYPDCTPVTGAGVLDIFDYLCFLNAFHANDPYACDCDLSTGAGVCDVLDFICFLNAFALGCE